MITISALKIDGKDIRELILDRMHSLVDFLFEKREDDTKSMAAICKIDHLLLFQRGLDKVFF